MQLLARLGLLQTEMTDFPYVRGLPVQANIGRTPPGIFFSQLSLILKVSALHFHTQAKHSLK